MMRPYFKINYGSNYLLFQTPCFYFFNMVENTWYLQQGHFSHKIVNKIIHWKLNGKIQTKE